MIERMNKIAIDTLDLRELKIRWRGERRVPGRFVESSISAGQVAGVTQREAEVIVRLAVIRVRIAPCRARNSGVEIFDRFAKLSASQRAHAHRVVAARIARIAAQRLLPV